MMKIENKYDEMISAFAADFRLAEYGDDQLQVLEELIKNKNEVLIKDIDLLSELDYGIRNGALAIVSLGDKFDEK